MQRRILDWGWEAVAVFREGGENSALRKGEPHSTSDSLPAPQPLNQSHLFQRYNYGKHLFLPFATSLLG